MKSVVLPFLCLVLASMGVFAQTVAPMNPCEGICTDGAWASHTVTTTVSRSTKDKDNRPKSALDVCTISVTFRKRVCLQETPPGSRVSIIIDGVCSDCPKSALDLLELTIIRALVADDPFNIRQIGNPTTYVTFSTKRCWALLYCNETFCAKPCECWQPMISQGVELQRGCDQCCLTSAEIKDDGSCNITARYYNSGIETFSVGACFATAVAPPCEGQSTGGVILDCIESCPDLFNKGMY